MTPGAAGRLHPIVANWYADPRLHAYKDDFGRSALRYGYPRPPAVPEPPGIALKLGLLADLRTASPEFFEENDYGWAFERSGYADPDGGDMETAEQSLRHQLTLLRTLVGTHEVIRTMRPPARLPLSGICARHVTSSHPSPACRLSNGFGYVTVPFGFQRFTRELLVALCGAAPGGGPDGPATFAALSGPTPPDAFARFGLPFLARTLARLRFADVADQHHAEGHLLSEVPEFAGCAVDLRRSVPGGLAAGLHELLIAFAVNHELGHVLYRHGAGRGSADEHVADATSLDVCFKDWGWQAAHGTATGLPDPAWIMLGPALFFWSIEMIVRLEWLAAPKPDDRHLPRLEIVGARRERINCRLRWLRDDVWPAFAVRVPKAALDAVSGFEANLAAAAAALTASPAVARAARAGRAALGPGPRDAIPP